MEKEVLIIIPAYNEAENIDRVLEGLESPPVRDFADVLIVDDGSMDDTGSKVRDRGHAVVEHIYNLGYGTALQSGYKYAVRKGYKYVIQMDADGQHDILNVVNLYEALRTKTANGRYPDIVLGARYMEGSAPFPVSAVKKFAIWLFRTLIRLSTGVDLHDPTTGLQGLSRPAFEYYSEFNHFADECPDSDMLIQMITLKFEVVEIPAIMHIRQQGKSMHSGLEPVWYMIRGFYEILSVIMRYKILKLDEGIGNHEAIRKEEENTGS